MLQLLTSPPRPRMGDWASLEFSGRGRVQSLPRHGDWSPTRIREDVEQLGEGRFQLDESYSGLGIRVPAVLHYVVAAEMRNIYGDFWLGKKMMGKYANGYTYSVARGGLLSLKPLSSWAMNSGPKLRPA